MNGRHHGPWKILTLVVAIGVLLAFPLTISAAEAPVLLGDCESYAVLAGQTITNTGPTTIGGAFGANIGVSPGTAVTGFPPGILNDSGVIHAGDAASLLAMTALTTAYNDAAGRTPTANLTGQDLGGMTLTSGVYKFDSSAQLTGTLQLDAQGDPDAVFIFQIGSTLTTASSSVIQLLNQARFCRVFWQVGSSATLGTDTTFVGHIFALTSISATTGVQVNGQLLAMNGSVTLDSNVIVNGPCAAISTTPSAGPTGTSASAAPTSGANPSVGDPVSMFGLLGFGFAGAAGLFVLRRRR